MAVVFADTAGWAAAFVRRQPGHATAQALVREWELNGTRLVTTNYVLAELVALLTRPLRVPRQHQSDIVASIQDASWIDVVHITPFLDAEAWALWRRRPDKEWSLVDCASFVVMDGHDIRQALTTDRHFEQAGFERLLK